MESHKYKPQRQARAVSQHILTYAGSMRDVHMQASLCSVIIARQQSKAAAYRVGQVTQFAELVAMLQPQHL